jgi:predicted NUDIX family NTP pyrophosphohydrolase
MRNTTSAAVALVRGEGATAEVLLVHPGGPFWARKDLGAWGLPKGGIEAGEDPLTAAKREFGEELGAVAPEGPYVPLGEARLKSGKRIIGFGVRGDFDVTTLRSNEVEMEYPARSGRMVRFPEVDRAVWATLFRATELVNPGQLPLVVAALEALRRA